MEYLFGASGESAIGNRKLRVRIGPSPQSLAVANPNEEEVPHFIDSPYFVGHIVVRVKNFRGVPPDGEPIKQADDYFGTRKRLFALQVCGRFKHEYTAEDVVFGAEFDRKVSPPTGAWVALKFANLIDPALQADMYGEKPWLFSPILCSMNRDPSKDVSLSTAKVTTKPSPAEILGEWTWHGTAELEEDNALLVGDDKEATFPPNAIAERRKHYQKAKTRKNTIFKPDLIYNFEIFAPFIDLNTFDLNLGISVNLLRYLRKQPIRLMAKSQSKNVHFFVIEFDLVKTGTDAGDDDDQDSEELSATASANDEFVDAESGSGPEVDRK
ncbi:hypothetical protein BC831DRAFT_397511 [Entophlyctis helioformis]|nr:hypothetical protein BC831DRAFT_397511 [Entophlyctis helioformis]